jgi:two-component system phosphate regulon sensor histidine kinase PhoR
MADRRWLDPKSRDVEEYRRIALWILLLVMLPAVSLGSVGILILAFSRATVDIVFGVLVLSFFAALVTGISITWVYVRRRAQQSTLQRDFISKVSHELRTPLTSLRMFIETLQMGRLDDKPDEKEAALLVMAQETARLTGMINRLLDWGRMEAGKRLYKNEPFEVQELVEHTMAALASARMLRKFDIQTAIDPALPTLKGDVEALAEALSNLLSNAIKYTGEDKRIRLDVGQDAKHVFFRVTDNGPGIPKREHRKVFDKFYRFQDPVTRDIEGTGLGLAMVQHITQSHGGKVVLQSEPGTGSTFTIQLPKKRCLAQRTAA